MRRAWTTAECLDLLAGGTELLLPNPAAARRLRSAFDARARAAGLRAWKPAPAFSWTQWTRSLWNDLVVAGSELRLLLNTAQELAVWREMVAADAAAPPLLGSGDALAELCQSAWSLACAYRCTADLRAAASTHDSRVFAGWADEFSRRCRGRGLLSAAALDEALARHLRDGGLAAPASLHLVGFESLTPAQATLLDAAKAGGTTVIETALQASQLAAPSRLHSTLPDERTEIETAVRWVRQTLLGQAASAPSASGAEPFAVAVLLPGSLDGLRDDLERAFREILTPELQPVTADLSSTPWSFSTGPSLTSLPLVADLLQLARWTAAPLPLDRMGRLLRSPFLTQGSDPDLNARFDAGGLRQAPLLRPELDLPALAGLARRFASEKARNPDDPTPAAWATAAAELAASAGVANPATERTFAEWTEFIRRLARAAGWPGDRVLNATEFEATRAWDGVLDLVATLDFSGRRVPFSAALQAIERGAQATRFSPPPRAPSVRVLSLAEAEGQVFDAAVLLHATDTEWPAAERTDPLLGWTLQRRLGMPGSDPAAVAGRALTQAERLLARCPRLLVLHAAEDSDGPRRPSPLIGHLGIPSVSAVELLPPSAEVPPVPEEIVPDAGPLPPLPNGEVRGGARLLKLQAACGFLAFAELRLGAADLAAPSAGFDARQSGNLLHTALQRFWAEVKTQAALRAMSSADRSTVIARCVREALAEAPRPHGRWDEAYIGLQTERLGRTLLPWMDEELSRAPFTVLEGEHKTEITLGPLTMHVRVDRVDQVEGGVVVVDYKTGYSADPKSWLGPRPEEPQLPLYALLAEPQELRGLAFARVRAGQDKKWSGYADAEGLLPRKGSMLIDLAAQTGEWRHTLLALAEDFYGSRADVHPKSFAANCTRCAQRLLCRLDPASLRDAAAPEEEGEEAGFADG